MDLWQKHLRCGMGEKVWTHSPIHPFKEEFKADPDPLRDRNTKSYCFLYKHYLDGLIFMCHSPHHHLTDAPWVSPDRHLLWGPYYFIQSHKHWLCLCTQVTVEAGRPFVKLIWTHFIFIFFIWKISFLHWFL